MNGVWTWLTANGAALGVLTSVGTLLVACLVFLEARSIRRTDWLLRQNQGWNELGSAVAELHKGSRIGELLMGKDVFRGAGEESLTPKEAFLLMSFFNVVSSEYHAYRANAINRRYVIHSLSMTARVASANKGWIFDFLIRYGYQADFVRAIAIVVVMGDDLQRRDICLRRELRASSRMGVFCGRRFRARLRKDFDHQAIETLCRLPASPESPVREVIAKVPLPVGLALTLAIGALALWLNSILLWVGAAVAAVLVIDGAALRRSP